MARFEPGDRVRISSRSESRHHRVPAYVKGHTGVVERVCAAMFGRPEVLAYGKPASPLEPVYRVRLKQRELWPEYGGPAHDCLELEIFEHWLEPNQEVDHG